MTRLSFQLELQSDVILSATSANAGRHAALNTIPGAAILGAVLHHCQGEDLETMLAAFHAGQLRFGCGLPLVEKKPAVPAPLSWHRNKRKREELWDLSKDSGTEKIQHEQVRDLFVLEKGGWVRPAFTYRQKTAMDREYLGRSRTGFFFGYQGLERGQTFWFQVDSVADTRSDLATQVTAILTEKPICLGRSRGAEYGQVTIALLENCPLPTHTTLVEAELLRFYLLTDAAFFDPITGMPTLTPGPESFGLPNTWRVIPDKSFVRRRDYVPYNSHRRAFDPSREVVEKGSVFTFSGPSTATLPVIQRLEQGVGRHVNEGLGRVMLEPWLLQRDHWCVEPDAVSQKDPVEAPTDFLFTLMDGRFQMRRREIEADKRAEDYVKHFESMNRYISGPGKTQWGALVDAITGATGLKELKESVQEFCNETTSRTFWQESCPVDPLDPGKKGATTYAAVLMNFIGENKESLEVCRLACIRLARRMQRHLAQKKASDHE